MNKVYQVIEAYYYIDETRETLLGTYSTREKAQIRSETLKQQSNIDSSHIFIKDILLDADVNESSISG